MNIEELQAALETSIFVDIALPTEERRHQAKVVATLKEAARLVANPNIEAAALDRHRNGRPKCYEGPKEDGCYCWDTTEAAVAAALTPGDTG